MNTRCIILAAGRGSRMGSFTDSQPKCLTILGGRSLLEWQQAALSEAGITEKIVVGGYKKHLLENNHYTLIENPDWAQTNMVSSLMCVEPFPGDSIISYSDIVYHPDHVKSLCACEADIAITVDTLWQKLWALRFENPLDDAESLQSDSGRLIEIGNKVSTVEEIQAQYMGLLKLTTKGWLAVNRAYLDLEPQERVGLDITSLLQILLKQGQQINVVYVSGKWCEVDSQNDWQAYEHELTHNLAWEHDWRWDYSKN